MDASQPPASLIAEEDRQEFLGWARDGGYDESWFNRFDSKSRDLEERFLDERREARP